MYWSLTMTDLQRRKVPETGVWFELCLEIMYLNSDREIHRLWSITPQLSKLKKKKKQSKYFWTDDHVFLNPYIKKLWVVNSQIFPKPLYTRRVMTLLNVRVYDIEGDDECHVDLLWIPSKLVGELC